MSVVIEYLQNGAGGPAPVLSFSDSFNRADQPFYVGDQWAITPLPNSTVLGPNIAGGINVAGSQLNLSIISSNGQNQTMLWPIPLTWNLLFSLPQFAQATMSADNSGGAIFAFNGPAAMVNVNLGTGYFIETNSTGISNSVGRYIVASIGVGTINSNGNLGFPFAIGDVLRIEVRPNTPAANQTTIKTFKNGVQQSSDIDAVSHLSFGVFGIYDAFVSSGITQSWQNFSGGSL